jgi:hypothetical protein
LVIFFRESDMAFRKAWDRFMLNYYCEGSQPLATNRAMPSCIRLFRTDAKKRPDRRAISASGSSPSKRNSDERLGQPRACGAMAMA